MKLNHDCVRSILLELEDKLEFDQHIYLNQLKEFETFAEFGEESTLYAILKLIEAGFLNGNPLYADQGLYNVGLSSITWEGHKFLDNIRDHTVWAKTKEATKSLSSISVTLLSSIANELLKKQLGLN